MTCSCAAFKKATEEGSDKEDYGCLIWAKSVVWEPCPDDPGSEQMKDVPPFWTFGADVLPSPRFCPWCGDSIRIATLQDT